jgi:hypothetical protein
MTCWGVVNSFRGRGPLVLKLIAAWGPLLQELIAAWGPLLQVFC